MADGAPWPRISIVTPSFDQAAFLEEAIRSVLLQGYPNLEHIVMDGGSTDGSADIVRRYEPWLAYWTSERDAGQSDALNRGFDRATGTILGWINSDDYLLPRALERVALAWHEAPEAAGWFGSCRRVDEAGALLYIQHPRRLDRDGLGDWHANGVAQPASFFSAAAWSDLGPLDTTLYCAFDFDFWLRLADWGAIRALPGELAAARIHGAAKTTAGRATMHAETWAVMMRHGYERVAVQDMTMRLGAPEVIDAERARSRVRRLETRVRQLEREVARLRSQSLLAAAAARGSDAFVAAHAARSRADWPAVRAALVRAAARDPSLLARRDFLSLAAQALRLRPRVAPERVTSRRGED
jgi:glycosyltransferase involved in cell wall biosynthesis